MRLAGDLGLPADGYQGNWIPHQLRPAIEDGVFFVGDSAGHCLPLTAEGIRTALYFGLACARELAPVLAGHATREQALSRYGAFSDSHERKYRWLLNTQRAVGRLTPSRAITRDGTHARLRACLRVGVQPLPGDRPTVVRGRQASPPARLCTPPPQPAIAESSRNLAQPRARRAERLKRQTARLDRARPRDLGEHALGARPCRPRGTRRRHDRPPDARASCEPGMSSAPERPSIT